MPIGGSAGRSRRNISGQQALTLKPEDDQAVTLKAKIADGLPDTAGTKSAQDRTTQAGQKTPQ